jgi:hypothetical protein
LWQPNGLENGAPGAHIIGMKLKLWIGSYLAVAAIAAIGVWLDCFDYRLMIVLALIAWIVPEAVVIWSGAKSFRKGQSE